MIFWFLQMVIACFCYFFTKFYLNSITNEHIITNMARYPPHIINGPGGESEKLNCQQCQTTRVKKLASKYRDISTVRIKFNKLSSSSVNTYAKPVTKSKHSLHSPVSEETSSSTQNPSSESEQINFNISKSGYKAFPEMSCKLVLKMCKNMLWFYLYLATNCWTHQRIQWDPRHRGTMKI